MKVPCLLRNVNSEMNFCDYCIEISLFHDGGPYHIETNPLIQKTGFGMIGTSVMKELNFASLAP